jgi:hypothetical protein
MGMDVYGTNPTSKEGEYFRNNVWWWRPLAEYILENHAEIVKSCTAWHTNDGDGLGELDALTLANALQKDISSGRMEEWETKYNKWRANLPREDCDYCNKTGIRTDDIGIKNGMHDKELDPEVQILTGRTHGWCNGCNGVGTRESFLSHYPFSIENMKNFIKFLEDCGGFRIF